MKEKLGCEHGLLCSAEDVMRCWQVSLRVEEVCRACVPGKKCCIHSVYRTHVNYKNGNPREKWATVFFVFFKFALFFF